MTNDPNRQDIKTFKVEAERLLASLEKTGTTSRSGFQGSQDDPALKPPEANLRTDAGESIPQSSARQKSSNPGLLPLLLVAGIAVGIGYMLHLNQARPSQSEKAPVESLQYQETCGSRANSSIEDWWPVLGPADPHVLEIVRTSYCGDAYINSNGYVQVASFHSPGDAARLSRLLSRLTGFAFRMGERYRPRQESRAQMSAAPAMVNQPSRSPKDVSAGLITASIQSVESLYQALSNKDFGAASRLYGENVSNQFDAGFYGQFERVSVSRLEVVSADSSIVTLDGVVHFFYSDGSVQAETRRFALDNTVMPPIVISSSFGKVLKSR